MRTQTRCGINATYRAARDPTITESRVRGGYENVAK